VHDADDDAEHALFHLAGELDGRIGGVGGLEPDAATVAAVGLHGELAVHAGDDHRAVLRLERAVHDQEVAVLHAGAGHRVALRADEVGRGGTRDQQLVEVERPLDVLLGGRGEPRHHGGRHERRLRARRRLHRRNRPGRRLLLAFHGMVSTWTGSKCGCFFAF